MMTALMVLVLGQSKGLAHTGAGLMVAAGMIWLTSGGPVYLVAGTLFAIGLTTSIGHMANGAQWTIGKLETLAPKD